MAANPPRDDGRKVNVKLIVVGLFVALLVVFALLNTHEVGVDWLFDTVSAPMILVIAISALLGLRDRVHRAQPSGGAQRLTVRSLRVRGRARAGARTGPRPARVKMRAST